MPGLVWYFALSSGVAIICVGSVGIMLQSWSSMMFLIKHKPWPIHLGTIWEVEDAGGAVSTGTGPSCTYLCCTRGWKALLYLLSQTGEYSGELHIC